MTDPDLLRRASLLLQLPGITGADIRRRLGISASTLAKARKAVTVRASRGDLVLAALTDYGDKREGVLPEPAWLASWIDHVNQDGTTADEIARDLDRLAAEGWLELDEGRFRLLRPWP